MEKSFDSLFERVKAQGKTRRVVVAGSNSDHTMEAIIYAMKEGLVTPIFCGDEKKTMELFKEYGGGDYDYVIHHCPTPEEAVVRAIRCINEGDADVLMKGLVDTSLVMKAALNRETGMRTDSPIVNALGFAEIETYHKILAMTDGSICISPDVQQKKAMIQNSVNAMHRMGWECPKVACLAAVEKVNPKMQATVDGAELQRMNRDGEITGCIVEGPVAFDCAVNKESAEIKGIKSDIAGDADLILFPDIQAANIGIKIIIETGRNKVGTAVLGLKAPIVMSSRGGSVGTKFRSLLVASAMC